MIQPNCSTRCTCMGYFYCKHQNCLIDGSSCYASGDPYYGSFDSKRFDFQGNCELCPRDNNEFVVIAVNTLWGGRSVSVTSLVKVKIPNRGLEIILSRSTITINGILQSDNGNRVVHRSSGVELSMTGGWPHVLLTVRYLLAIKWTG